jgi:hypothetical protein
VKRKVVMIGAVAICWANGKTRNKSYFQGIRPKDPTDVVLFACHFLMSGINYYREAHFEGFSSRGLR